MKHTLAWLDDATGKVRIDYRPVHDVADDQRHRLHPAQGAGVLGRG